MTLYLILCNILIVYIIFVHSNIRQLCTIIIVIIKSIIFNDFERLKASSNLAPSKIIFVALDPANTFNTSLNNRRFRIVKKTQAQRRFI